MLSSIRIHASLAVVCFLLVTSSSYGQTSPPQKVIGGDAGSSTADDIRDMKRQLNDLQVELKEIKALLLSQKAALPLGASRPTSLPPKISEVMVLPFVPKEFKGAENAPLVLVEFSDPQCPFCNDFAKHTLPSFDQAYIAPGKIRLLSVEVPLESHPEAEKLSLATLCAGEQAKYWQMHDALMNAKAGSASDAISSARTAVGLDDQAFGKCMASSVPAKLLASHVEAAKAAGVYSTPTFLLGRIENGTVRGVTFVGDMPPEQFSKQIEAATAILQGGNDDQKSKK
jgi:protein-disulfide isomerase